MAQPIDMSRITATPQRTFLGHPIGLYILFFTEMWERFSFYGMRALLMLYMVNDFRWRQSEASGIYKWYTTLVYMTPLLGGFLADRYLGNRLAVIIGAILMAIGHFLMVFPDDAIFYSALGFLIMGNGFFKPNISTQVGRLYPANDPRRDGAYTIFYMGINLGAFLSPVVCGWLAANTAWEYHAGFTAAGIGMVIGLLIYVFGMPFVRELDPNAPSYIAPTAPPQAGVAQSQSEHVSAGPPPVGRAEGAITSHLPPGIDQAARAAAVEAGALPLGPIQVPTEKECQDVRSSLPTVNRMAATFLVALGVAVAVAAPILWLTGIRSIFDFVFFELIAGCAFMAAWILAGVRNAVRDRVIAIYAVAVFVVFFWGGFEQAGNVLNIWADQSTNRYLWTEASPPPLKPTMKEVRAEGWLAGLFNPVPTAWFQAINALAIVALAPIFAWLWTTLDRRGIFLTIPLKMATGILFLSMSFAVMVGAARSENQPTTLNLASLPAGIGLNSAGQLCPVDEKGNPDHFFFAGRLAYDSKSKELVVHGALPIVERDRILAHTVPAWFAKAIKDLNDKAKKATEEAPVSIQLQELPPGFDWSYTNFKNPKTKEFYCTFNASDRTITATSELAGKDILALEVAAAEPAFRQTMNSLVELSSTARVSGWWLFWAYILATFGELCLSPVGLSMVSKLAPAKNATMLMGMWLLTSAFGQFLGGELGERYGEQWDPTQYFLIFLVGTLVASLSLYVLVKKIGSMMHGVR